MKGQCEKEFDEYVVAAGTDAGLSDRSLSCKKNEEAADSFLAEVGRPAVIKRHAARGSDKLLVRKGAQRHEEGRG